MDELDTLRAGSKRHEDLVTLYRSQARQCREMLDEAQSVWRDRAAERAWQRNIRPQLDGTKHGQEQLKNQARHHAEALGHAERAAEHIRAALAEAEAVASAVERAQDEARRTERLAVDAEHQARSAQSAAAAALASVQGL